MDIKPTYQELEQQLKSLEAQLEEKIANENKMSMNQQRLDSLWRVSSMVKEGFQDICDTLLEEIVTMTASQYGFFGFIDNEETEMTVYSWSKSVMKQCAVNIQPLIFPMKDSGIWGDAIREKKAVIYNDYSTQLTHKKGTPEGHVPITRILSVPVFSSSGKLVSLGCVANKKSNYDTEDKNQLIAYLSNVQLVLENRKKEEERKHYLQKSLSESMKKLVKKDTELDQRNKALLKEIAIRKKAEEELLETQKELTQQARTDSLTGLYNRKHFNELAEIEVDKSLRYAHPLSVIMYDLDYFKKINDRYGHPCGDRVLKKIAEITKKEVRKIDIISRYGGEEFIVLLPEISASEAAIVAERLRAAIENTTVITENRQLAVTASFGVSDHLIKSSSLAVDSILSELIVCADKALYAAKNAGRNRVTIFDAKE